MQRFTEHMLFVGVKLPSSLVERIKAAARLRAVHEARHVAYVEMVREALVREFPEPAGDARPM